MGCGKVHGGAEDLSVDQEVLGDWRKGGREGGMEGEREQLLLYNDIHNYSTHHQSKRYCQH